MKSIFLLVFLMLLFCSSDAKCYILNGLDYKISEKYVFKSYYDIVEDLDGSDERLATKKEMEDLFNHFNLFGNGENIEYGWDEYEQLIEKFPITWGGGLDSSWKNSVWTGYIIGRYEMDDESGYVPYTFIQIDSILVDPFIPIFELSLSAYIDRKTSPGEKYAEGMGAWIVTPVKHVPEPDSFILFVIGLAGIYKFFKKNNYISS